MIQRFLSFLEEVSDKIKEEIDKESRFLILSSNNADALASSILLINFFYKNNVEAHFRFVNVIDFDFLDLLFGSSEKAYDQDVVLFLDFGSKILGKISDNAKATKKKFFIFDHHHLTSRVIKSENLYQINPNIFGLNGKKEISTSTMLYYLLKNLGYNFRGEEILCLAGPISEKQDIKELSGLNKELLNELVNNDLIEVKKGIKLTGIKNKPLYKALSSSTEIFIPNISGSDEKAIEFLKKIFPDKKPEKINYFDLNQEEEKKLINEIIKIRVLNNIMLNEEILGELYILKNEKDIGDLKELSLILNAAISLREQATIIKYFIEKDNFDNVREIEVTFRSKISKILSDILKGSIKFEDNDGIFLLKLNEKEILSPYISEILSFNNLLDKKAYVIYEEAGNYYRISISKSKKTEEIANLVASLSDKFEIFYGTESINTFYVKKNSFNDFKSNLVDLLSKFF
ncbi:MAG: hypothetical protein QXT85_02015 [Nanopusillaceae archaeon]